jgi:hypothetical protein
VDHLLTLNNTVTVNAGGTLAVGGETLSMPSSLAAATVNVPALPPGLRLKIPAGTFTGGTTLNVGRGTTVDLAGGTGQDGMTFNVAQGATVNFLGGTYAGGMNFNVAQGATVNLSNGQDVTYSGTLTGSGDGTVRFAGNWLHPGIGGLTLNFPADLFQWTGGAFFCSQGDVTNLGTMNLAGANDKGIYSDGKLDNFGTIIQTGSGNLGLHSDNVSPTTLKIEPGASYLIESDSGIDNPYGGQTALVNAGTIRKTAGSGTSTLYIPGPISNTGTIEADSGTLYLDSNSLTQIENATLNVTSVDLAGQVNANLRSYTNGSYYPSGGTTLDVGNVPFTLAEYPGDGTGVVQTSAGSQALPSSVDIPVNIANPAAVFTLINSAWGQNGYLDGSVEFFGTEGAYLYSKSFFVSRLCFASHVLRCDSWATSFRSR